MFSSKFRLRSLSAAFLLLSFSSLAQVTISGKLADTESKEPIPFVKVFLKNAADSSFVSGAFSDEAGIYSVDAPQTGNYYLEFQHFDFQLVRFSLFVGNLSQVLNVPNIYLEPIKIELEELVVEGKTEDLNFNLDKKSYSADDNVVQAGGTVLQLLQNLPGVTVQDGKVLLRGSDKVMIFIDGKQTALTGFGSQSGLENIPASSVEKVEIINNPSAKFDANGNAGIINIVLKKSRKEGFNGKVGFTAGAGALWVRKENLPSIRPQYTITPKLNPNLSLNYRKNKVNTFLQVDNLYTQTLNKNEFVTRTYDDGTVIQQQLKRNRNTNFLTAKLGMDWYLNDNNTFTFSGMFGSEKILDYGDQPFFNGDLTQRLRLWQFLEDELKTTAMFSGVYQHKFKTAGHTLNVGFNYTFHRENEKYYYDNYLPTSTGTDAFKLLSDEQVNDFNVDYVKPLRYGRIEAGVKMRYRYIPTNMQFKPGQNSVLDSTAGGWANYKEVIPALYGNYILENDKLEAELGLRVEYVKIDYQVNPDHNTYKSSGYHYTQPFPNLRLAYKFNAHNKLSLYFNRRVDRPNEVDIRIFPKYDDAEIIKVGNPGLRPQFTNNYELGYKTTWKKGFFFLSVYYKDATATITRISTIVPGSTLIYAVFQNAGKSQQTGMELSMGHRFSKAYNFTLNATTYYNEIAAFTVNNLYPTPTTYTAAKESIYSGSLKMTNNFTLPKQMTLQIILTYLAPDVIPQGKIDQRFSVDFGLKKSIQKGKGSLFINATDLFNTLVIRKQIQGNGFHYTTTDYYETQVIRVGYTRNF